MILSNELAPLARVFCPKFTSPAPVINVIGLTLFEYSVSLCPSLSATLTNSPSASMKPVDVAFVMPPRLVPAGANHGNDTWSLNAIVLSIPCDAGTTTLFPALSLVNKLG